ncbi:unnamed protein product [Allacma fusca]|uniref:ATPase AAA-type core domain-containing protein n=1 Tax=Allacma fusca TaxID=39272 RepID=A0A8J2K4P4_9HEXA|nr:unnamed protein product [Allacma fusca]
MQTRAGTKKSRDDGEISASNKKTVEKRGRKKRKSEDQCVKKGNAEKDVDLEIVAFLKSGIPAVVEKLKEIRKDNGRKSTKGRGDNDESMKEIEVEKVVDLEVIAFLKSGVPAATSRAQKLVDIRREEEELAKTHQYFPTCTHVPDLNFSSLPDHSSWEKRLGLKMRTSFCDQFQFEHNIEPEGFIAFRKKTQPWGDISKILLCCKLCKSFSPLYSLTLDEDSNSSSSTKISYLPWIEKYPVQGLSHLAVETESLEKVEEWLKCWKNDIKDDGGKSRKFLEKRKRKGSESDFIESEDGAEKSKSLLLYGSTGTAKTATVVALAKKLNFKIVEVNFSTSRSGKDVLRRVEEATLSHRLESSHACLLLFKDICLLEPKEDEGFIGAVAQLITTSCRPIVMTMSVPLGPIAIAGDCDSLALDTKIEKKDPMPIHFPVQCPSVIVKKVLLPIVKSEFPSVDPRQYMSTLYSIARHCNGDIRQSIHQMQFLLQTSGSEAIINNYHIHVCPYIDFNFLRKNECTNRSPSRIRRRIVDPELVLVADEKKYKNGEKEVKKSKNQVQQELQILDTLSRQLCAAVDLDRTNEYIHRRSHHEYHSDDDMKTGRGHLLKSWSLDCFKQLCSLPVNTDVQPPSESQDSGVSSDSDRGIENKKPFHIRSFIFDCDKDLDVEKKIQHQYVKLEEYCGTTGDFMSSGTFNYDNFAYVRTIIKTNMLNSSQKRNRRVSCYFNRLGTEIVDSICDTFDFRRDLLVAKNMS